MLKKYIKNLGEIAEKCLSKNLCMNARIVYNKYKFLNIYKIQSLCMQGGSAFQVREGIG